jgi:hypothetical protein
LELSAKSDRDGSFSFAFLPPGNYWLRIEPPEQLSTQLQPAEVHSLILPVAGAIEQPIELRPLTDSFEQSKLNQIAVSGSEQLVRFYGPDLDLSRVAYVKRWETGVTILEPSVSAVIDPMQIAGLPFQGRDIYTMLALLPGVTSDATTVRSLGLSANGIRAGSSNYLLDGFEANNYLVGGPLASPPPEAIQEYRLSTNGYSAQYGRTAGYIANAVTQRGAAAWHGQVYGYVKNDALNANDFQNNASLQPSPRPGLHEFETGYQFGGPLFPRKVHGVGPDGTVLAPRFSLFVSSSADFLRSAGRLPSEPIIVPDQDFLDNIAGFSSLAGKLLAMFPPPGSRPIPAMYGAGVAQLSPPAETDRRYLANRLDVNSGPWRAFFRWIGSRIGQPDFIWSPYPAFISGLRQATSSSGATLTYEPSARFAAEVRLGVTDDDLNWGRAHPEIPTLVIPGPPDSTPILPGSPAAYSYTHNGRVFELDGDFVVGRGRNLIKFGGGMFRRTLFSDLPYDQAGYWTFSDIINFATPSNMLFYPALDRTALANHQLTAPRYARNYESPQMFGFVEHSYTWNPRFVTHLGIRVDSSGNPENVGQTPDDLIGLGTGADFATRFRNARFALQSPSQSPLFGTPSPSVALRSSFALDLTRNSQSTTHTVLRGGYGIYYDRPFENAWLGIANNAFVFDPNGVPVANYTNFLQPVAQTLATLSNPPVFNKFPMPTLIQPQLAAGYAEDLFFRLQHQITAHLAVDTGLQASLGRKLLATDVLNRTLKENTQLPEIAYLSSQGDSDYFAWTTSLSYRTSRAYLSAAYSWSHAIDNQSDPLAGSFFDLSFTIDPSILASRQPGFSTEYDSRSDRGNANFDQRHNLTLASVWNLPRVKSGGFLQLLTEDWEISELAVFRSGQPFTVIDAINFDASGNYLLTRRANLIDPSGVWLSPRRGATGGVDMLNHAAFCQDSRCENLSVQGNTGRNAFYGPGLYNIDLSLARSFRLPRLGEAGRFTIRADAFNFLNHANLNQPDPNLTSSSFGYASFGRIGTSIGFPALSPFMETARQIQLMLRVSF